MIRVKAYAKVNLFLEITGKRPDGCPTTSLSPQPPLRRLAGSGPGPAPSAEGADSKRWWGYHTLSTVFQTVSLADDITLHSHPDVSLTCSDVNLPVDGRNLAVRAAMKMQSLLKVRSGVHMTLNKQIPTSAGLGGGSSDAAAVLSGLSTLWKCPTARALHRCAAVLGADVPFFLSGGTCLGEGIGDQIKKLPPLPKTWLVLVYPGFGIATRDAYARVRLPFKKARPVQKFIPLLKKPARIWAGRLFNRFEEFIFPAHPQLAAIKRELLEAGALGALMTGSGSSVFGVAPSPAKGHQILKKISQKYPRSWLVYTV